MRSSHDLKLSRRKRANGEDQGSEHKTSRPPHHQRRRNRRRCKHGGAKVAEAVWLDTIRAETPQRIRRTDQACDDAYGAGGLTASETSDLLDPAADERDAVES